MFDGQLKDLGQRLSEPPDGRARHQATTIDPLSIMRILSPARSGGAFFRVRALHAGRRAPLAHHARSGLDLRMAAAAANLTGLALVIDGDAVEFHCQCFRLVLVAALAVVGLAVAAVDVRLGSKAAVAATSELGQLLGDKQTTRGPGLAGRS